MYGQTCEKNFYCQWGWMGRGTNIFVHSITNYKSSILEFLQISLVLSITSVRNFFYVDLLLPT